MKKKLGMYAETLFMSLSNFCRSFLSWGVGIAEISSNRPRSGCMPASEYTEPKKLIWFTLIRHFLPLKTNPSHSVVSQRHSRFTSCSSLI